MSNYIVDFIADSSGTELSFVPDAGTANINVDNVGLQHVVSSISSQNYPINEFLTGNTDNGKEIIFRADTQLIQLMSEFEIFGNPIAIVTKLQRGSLMKCFVAFGDEDFYELEGTATKGISIIKVHSKNRDNIETPPIAREIKISWRDSSKQLCRLTQGGIIFLSTTMDYTE